MRFARSLSLLLLLAAPLAAQARKPAKAADPDKPVKGGGSLPAGWSARTDDEGKEADVKFVTMEKGYHVTLGPATILWRAADKVDGTFHAVALFGSLNLVVPALFPDTRTLVSLLTATFISEAS